MKKCMNEVPELLLWGEWCAKGQPVPETGNVLVNVLNVLQKREPN